MSLSLWIIESLFEKMEHEAKQYGERNEQVLEVIQIGGKLNALHVQRSEGFRIATDLLGARQAAIFAGTPIKPEPEGLPPNPEIHFRPKKEIP